MPGYNIRRSVLINAPADKVFEAVADFSNWTTWSPWLIAEPDAKVEISENPSAVGGKYSWDGELVGSGEVEHKLLDRNSLVQDEIRFRKPFKSVADVGFELNRTGKGTRLTWYMDGYLPWFLFWMKPSIMTFVSMDYDRGLRMLKDWLESGTIHSKIDIRGVETVKPMRVLGVRRQCAIDEVGEAMSQAFNDAREMCARNKLNAEGTMVSVYHKLDMKKQQFDFTSGFIVESDSLEPAGMHSWRLPACQAFRVDHQGHYEHLGNGWSVANQHCRYKKLKQSKVGAFEVYRSTPDNADANDCVTEIYLPLKG